MSSRTRGSGVAKEASCSLHPRVTQSTAAADRAFTSRGHSYTRAHDLCDSSRSNDATQHRPEAESVNGGTRGPDANTAFGPLGAYGKSAEHHSERSPGLPHQSRHKVWALEPSCQTSLSLSLLLPHRNNVARQVSAISWDDTPPRRRAAGHIASSCRAQLDNSQNSSSSPTSSRQLRRGARKLRSANSRTLAPQVPAIQNRDSNRRRARGMNRRSNEINRR